jgi:hypothetical protein
MKLVVPTTWCKCTLREQLVLGGEIRHPGEIVDLPYGIALDGMAHGIIGAILDADAKHAEAIDALEIYGGDAWFPPHFQTIGRLKDYFAEAQKEQADK